MYAASRDAENLELLKISFPNDSAICDLMLLNSGFAVALRSATATSQYVFLDSTFIIGRLIASLRPAATRELRVAPGTVSTGNVPYKPSDAVV